jgi:hypothetical protein
MTFQRLPTKRQMTDNKNAFKTTLQWFAVAAITVGMIGAMEATCLFYLGKFDLKAVEKLTTKTTPFFHSNSGRISWFDLTNNYAKLDPQLGYRFVPGVRTSALTPDENMRPKYTSEFNLFVDDFGFIGNAEKSAQRSYRKPGDVYRIIVSGGSTVAGWGATSNTKTWPAVLERLLNERREEFANKNVEVINAGVFGYNITQEFIRFSTELIYMQPDMLIVFDGINENWTFKGMPKDYGVKGYHRQTMAHLMGKNTDYSGILPYTRRFLAENTGRASPYQDDKKSLFYRSNEAKFHSYDLFISRVRQFSAICREFQIKFAFVLQPIMGAGSKPFSEEEVSLQQNWYGNDFYKFSFESYTKRLKHFYPPVMKYLQTVAEDTDDIRYFDMTNAFDSIPERIYADPRHYNDFGQKILAKKIGDMLLNWQNVATSAATQASNDRG